jgi:hypothetical protein
MPYTAPDMLPTIYITFGCWLLLSIICRCENIYLFESVRKCEGIACINVFDKLLT